MKILAFTTDVIPVPGLPTSGTALRTFGLVQGLRSAGHEVVISVPKSALERVIATTDIASLPRESQAILEELRENPFDAKNQQSVINNLRPDVLLCGHWPAMCLSYKPSQAVILDLAGPHLLERHYQGTGDHTGAVLGKLGAFANSDYFIVSGPSQRLYFLSYLLRAGVESPEKKIVNITMPMDPNIPDRSSRPLDRPDYPHFMFGGVFLPWQNPSKALLELGEQLSARNRGKLTLIGGKHPSYDIKQGIYGSLFSDLSKNKRVETKPLLPYQEFLGELSHADVAVDVMSWNLERQLAMTIRSTTYLWSGLPVIYNDYADLGGLIQRYDAGWCVSPAQKKGLIDVLDEIYADPDVVRRKSQNATRLAREEFAWDRAIAPLLEFLGTPERKRAVETDITIDFPDSAEYPIVATKPVEQYFTCRIDGLSRIECRLATHNRDIRTPLHAALYRVEGEDNTALRSFEPRNLTHKLISKVEVEQGQLRNNEWVSIDVDPVADSAGHTFLLQLEAEEDNEQHSVSPWVVKGNPYPLLGLYYQNQRVDNACISLRTSCARQR